MSNRVQVVLSDADKELFSREAARAGMSLSAWLRQAAHDRVRAEASDSRMSPKELEAFFAACRRREEGVEPDWEQHERIIERSRRSGAAES
jgi:hypothetical protein